MAFTKSFYEKYDNTSDVIRAQEHFVTEYGVKEMSISLNTNIYEYCYKNKPLKNKSKTYKLKIKEPYDTEDDYLRMFYFKRRQGWGKYKIINL